MTKIKIFSFKNAKEKEIQKTINSWIKEKESKFDGFCYDVINQSESCDARNHYITISILCEIIVEKDSGEKAVRIK